jgi:hypothetical protein
MLRRNIQPEIDALVERELTDFPTIDSGDIHRLLQLTRQMPCHLLIFKLARTAVTCLNADTTSASSIVADYLGFFRQLAVRYGLPEVLIAINMLDEARVLPINNGQLFTIPRDSVYATLVRFHGVRLDALLHPAIFSPFPYPIFLQRVPIFSVSKIRNLHGDILFPWLGSLSFQPGATDQVSWRKKKPILYWRGFATGGLLRLDNWSMFPRVRLAAAAKQQGSPMLDIGISAVIQSDPLEQGAITAAIQSAGLYKSYDPFEKNFEHRYLYDIEGNSFSARLSSFFFGRIP